MLRVVVFFLLKRIKSKGGLGRYNSVQRVCNNHSAVVNIEIEWWTCFRFIFKKKERKKEIEIRSRITRA